MILTLCNGEMHHQYYMVYSVEDQGEILAVLVCRLFPNARKQSIGYKMIRFLE